MLVELGCSFILAKTVQYLFSEECEFKNKWKDILMNCKVEGIRNKENKTFIISKVYKKKYGYLCTINIPSGLSVEALEKAKKVIEDNLNCIVEIEKERFENYAKVKIINRIFDFEYNPVETRPNELYMGQRLDNSKYFIDLNIDSQILISGKTGTGKSFLFASILTNLIYHNKKEVEIYLLQIKKGEIDIFKNCPGVKFTSDDLREILVILEKITDTIHRRSKQFTAAGIKNISQWNKHFPTHKMKRIIVGVEEISFFMNDEDSSTFKYFNDIVKAGRSAGVHLIGLTQRTTAVNLGGNGELKSQLTVITARQRSTLDSRNAIDIEDAAYLSRQEFIASSNDGYITFKAPRIDEDFKVLNKYVPEIKVPNKKTKDITINNKLTFEESQKLKTHYECYTLDKSKHIEKVIEAIEAPKAPIIPKGKKGVKIC